MVLDPLGEELDLPSALVEGGDGRSWQGKVVGAQDERLGRDRVVEADTTQVLGVCVFCCAKTAVEVSLLGKVDWEAIVT